MPPSTAKEEYLQLLTQLYANYKSYRKVPGRSRDLRAAQATERLGGGPGCALPVLLPSAWLVAFKACERVTVIVDGNPFTPGVFFKGGLKYMHR